MEDYAIFLVSRSSDGEREWFSARDPADGVVIPAESRDDAYALVSSLNRAFSHHARQLLSEAQKCEREARAKALEDVLSALTAHELYQYRPKAFQGFIDYARSALQSEEANHVTSQ